MKSPHAKIGELTWRRFRGRAQQGGIAERKAIIDREHDLPITKQAQVLRISRGSVYCELDATARPISADRQSSGRLKVSTAPPQLVASFISAGVEVSGVGA